MRCVFVGCGGGGLWGRLFSPTHSLGQFDDPLQAFSTVDEFLDSARTDIFGPVGGSGAPSHQTLREGAPCPRGVRPTLQWKVFLGSYASPRLESCVPTHAIDFLVQISDQSYLNFSPFGFAPGTTSAAAAFFCFDSALRSSAIRFPALANILLCSPYRLSMPFSTGDAHPRRRPLLPPAPPPGRPVR